MSVEVIIIIIIVRLILEACKNNRNNRSNINTSLIENDKSKVMLFRFNRRMRISEVLSGSYINTKVFYGLRFRYVPNMALVTYIDTKKAFSYIEDTMKMDIVEFYQFTQYDQKEGKSYFITSVFVLRNARMIELGADYVMVFFNSMDFSWARNMEVAFADFKIDENKTSDRVIGFTLPVMN